MIHYRRAFVQHRTRLIEWLTDGAQWRRERIRMFGKVIECPRRTAWYGDPQVNYRYAGEDHVASGWPPLLAELCTSVSDATGVRFNFVLMNRYQTGRDHMGWHRDDERCVHPLVASITLGEPRRFAIEHPDGHRWQHCLANGSLLIFDARRRHRVPPTSRPVGERFNLSFRRVAA